MAKKRVKIEGLKTSESGQELAPGLDAEFLDVYQVIVGLTFKSADLIKEKIGIEPFPQGTHGVIMVMDITKAWTMDYIRKESEKVISLSTESQVIEKSFEMEIKDFDCHITGASPYTDTSSCQFCRPGAPSAGSVIHKM